MKIRRYVRRSLAIYTNEMNVRRMCVACASLACECFVSFTVYVCQCSEL